MNDPLKEATIAFTVTLLFVFIVLLVAIKTSSDSSNQTQLAYKKMIADGTAEVVGDKFIVRTDFTKTDCSTYDVYSYHEDKTVGHKNFTFVDCPKSITTTRNVKVGKSVRTEVTITNKE